MKAQISNSCFQLPSNLLNRLVKGTSPLSLEGYYYGYLTESRSGGAKKSKETESDNLIVYERGMGSCLCCGSAFAQQTTLKKGLKRLDSMLWQEKPQGRMRTVSSTCTGRRQLQMIAVFCDCVWLKYESRSVMNPPRRGLYLSYVVVTRCSTMDSTAQQLNNNPPSWLLAPYRYITINVVFLPHPCVANEAHSLQLAAVSNHFSNK